jgi:hypothetical protein
MSPSWTSIAILHYDFDALHAGDKVIDDGKIMIDALIFGARYALRILPRPAASEIRKRPRARSSLIKHCRYCRIVATHRRRFATIHAISRLFALISSALLHVFVSSAARHTGERCKEEGRCAEVDDTRDMRKRRDFIGETNFASLRAAFPTKIPRHRR